MIAQFEKVCRIDEIAEGAARVFHINGRSILVARHDGNVYALDNICSHDGGDLGGGNIVDGQIECPRHGARFDIRTGEATRMPAVCEIDTYDVKIENGDLFVAVAK
jgi:3-phenylpropionate/trans-cinnamate dioxygenase ferredoxin subunit